MSKVKFSPPHFEERGDVLARERNRKMAQSAHSFVRGNTAQFYEWLDSSSAPGVPEGPPIWICGDCHVGNLGPVADAAGRIRIHVRDLDQTVIGNPALDLIRLALSLASAARGSNLPGVVTAHMLEAVMEGYESAFEHDFDEAQDNSEPPDAVRIAMREARRRTWKQLAKEHIGDTRPKIPLGPKFWPITEDERGAIESVFSDRSVARVVTMVESRSDEAKVDVIDSAYWMKGCSSLGLLRYGALLGVSDETLNPAELCLMDIKEAVASVAPAAKGAEMPDDYGQRVVEGALHISPFLGERMSATTLLDRPVFIRELLPQDLALELNRMMSDEVMKTAAYLATVVGFAHARQMDSSTRSSWQNELSSNRSPDLDAPSWLWTNVVGLLIDHERTYLEHCRRYALADQAR
jgi:uncharacterized protein (DUF2252 family)